MKTLKYVLSLALVLLFCVQPFAAFAEDDGWDDVTETTTAITTTHAQTTTTTTTTYAYATTTATTGATEIADVPAPIVRITRQSMPKKPGAGETFSVTVAIYNYGSVPLMQGLAVFEPGEGLALAERSDSKVVSAIDAKGNTLLTLKLRVLKEYTLTEIPVTVTYSYSYKTPMGVVSTSAEDKIIIPMQTPPKKSEEQTTVSSATPNIIVSEYDYGGTIAAGDAFTLRLKFTNTSRKLAAENIMMAVETGEGLSITGASNTYYYASLGAGQSTVQTIPMRVLTSAGAQGAKVGITFRYEYVDNNTRGTATTNESLSVPIYIPDRFIVTEPDTELIGVQNEELSVSVPYVNKGKSEVSNVHAKLIYDEDSVYCEQPNINLGNFEPGKSGTIDFYFIPSEPGSNSVKILVTYEDELLREKSVTVSVPFTVDEAVFEDDMPMEEMPEEESSSTLRTVIIIAAIVLAVVLVIVLIVVLRKRKKKKADPSVSFDWSFAQTEDNVNEKG